jgi:hypothetical protein|tara:strand:+ start:312 stop:602 length:291 start_codon:yes stop_codon:yes gene_type:complete
LIDHEVGAHGESFNSTHCCDALDAQKSGEFHLLEQAILLLCSLCQISMLLAETLDGVFALYVLVIHYPQAYGSMQMQEKDESMAVPFAYVESSMSG